MEENHRDEKVLSAANALVFSHLGTSIAAMESAEFTEMVREVEGRGREI